VIIYKMIAHSMDSFMSGLLPKNTLKVARAKYNFMQIHDQLYPIRRMCKLMQVHLSNYDHG